MTTAVSEVSGTSSAARIARRSKKGSVEPDEVQFVMGVIAQTDDLQTRVHELLIAKGMGWEDLAGSLGVTRQAVLASINRRHVQYSRVKAIASRLGVPTGSLLVKPWNLGNNDKIL
jgi:hypothetical protein